MRLVVLFALAFPLACTGRPLAHFYYVDDAASFASLEQNAARIDVLSPVWVHVAAGGEIRVSADARVAGIAASHRIQLMPVVMNTDFKPEIARELLRDERRRSELAARLAAAAVESGWAGLQLDFENIDAADRDGYTALAEQLGTALHKAHRKLSVAVAAPVYSIGTADKPAESWQTAERSAAFDYARLARAADFITLMTYDQYTAPDVPGPIAGIAWVEECVRQVLRSAPADKILLGLPLYHRHWNGARVTTGAWAEAAAEAIRANAAPGWDSLHEEPVVRWKGHEIWFHDWRSIRRRLDLLSRHGLRGFSAWRLGQEDPSVWPRLFAERGAR